MRPELDPKRDLNLASAENVRDLGGYPTVDGGMTQWARFVRSGDMDQLTEAEQQQLIDYGVEVVIDLRMAKEIAAAPNVFASSSKIDFRIHDFWGDRFDDYRSRNKTASPEQKLADLYCSGLEKSGFVMKEIMSTFADGPELGFAFHCRSGKDRTGLVSAMVLSIAGVSDSIICDDYAITSSYLSSHAVNPVNDGQPGAWQRGCAQETMAATLAFIREGFGSVSSYLTSIGVSETQIGRIREKIRD